MMSASDQWIVDEFALSEIGLSRLWTKAEAFRLSVGLSEWLVQNVNDPTCQKCEDTGVFDLLHIGRRASENFGFFFVSEFYVVMHSDTLSGLTA